MNEQPNDKPDGAETEPHLILPGRQSGFMTRLRNYFFTGLVVAAPIGLTIWITRWFIDLIDTWFTPLIPMQYQPDNYLPFDIPGLGLIIAFFLLTLLGALTANFFGRAVLNFGERGLIEYPRKGIYCIVFITTQTSGEIVDKTGHELVSVFLPTTPNPTSGFLLFVPRADVQILDMTIEEGAKLIISTGLVEPPQKVANGEPEKVVVKTPQAAST